MEKTEINKKVLVIIPCYNEADNVLRLYADLIKVKQTGFEIYPLFVNDYSNDDTRLKLEGAGLNYLDNPINLGIGGTVQLGFLFSENHNFDFAVQMDGDGQHPPEFLFGLIDPLVRNECDVTIGSRFIRGQGFKSTFLRRVGINFFYWLNKKLVGVSIKDSTSGYRAYNQKAIRELAKYYPDEYPEPEAVVYLVNKKFRIKEVPVEMQERLHGKSSIRSFSTIYYMFKVSLNTLFLHFKMKFHGNV